MKTRMKFFVMICVATSLFISSCKKDPGPAGKDGTNGKDGNANVQSQTFTASTWSWDNTNLYDYAAFTAPPITAAIANTGAVLVYVKTSAGDWAPLPRTITPSSTYTQSQRYIYNTNSLTIIIQDSDLTSAAPGTMTFKLVVIASSMIKPNINYNEYSEVQKAYNLQ